MRSSLAVRSENKRDYDGLPLTAGIPASVDRSESRNVMGMGDFVAKVTRLERFTRALRGKYR